MLPGGSFVRPRARVFSLSSELFPRRVGEGQDLEVLFVVHTSGPFCILERTEVEGQNKNGAALAGAGEGWGPTCLAWTPSPSPRLKALRPHDLQGTCCPKSSGNPKQVR